MRTETTLYERLPNFAWRRPVRYVARHGAPVLYGCRICWAIPDHKRFLATTPEKVHEHITAEHPEAPHP